MKVTDMVSWYQKKIATYDKEPWEKTVEEKILYAGFGGGVRMKNAKLKTELIDVDLVRGSTFPKAKPKQSLLTVLRLALLRFLLLPLYAHWWVRQTCSSVFLLLFLLYITQIINWAIYFLHFNSKDYHSETFSNQTLDFDIKLKLHKNTISGQVFESTEQSSFISLSELLIPMTLSFFLSLIHSQIVATNNLSGGCKNGSTKRRRFSNASGSGSSINVNRCSREVRLRRRKKLFKIRSQDLQEGTGVLLQVMRSSAKSSEAEVFFSQEDQFVAMNRTPDLVKVSQTTNNNNATNAINSAYFSNQGCGLESRHDMVYLKSNCRRSSNVNLVNLVDGRLLLNCSDYALTGEKTLIDSVSNDIDENTIENEQKTTNFNGEIHPAKSVRIDDCVQEINCEYLSSSSGYLQQRQQPARGALCEDDGFESFNGKSSSGEETSPRSNLPEHKTKSSQIVDEKPKFAENNFIHKTANQIGKEGRLHKIPVTDIKHKESSDDTDIENDDDEQTRSRTTPSSDTLFNNNEYTTSATEWLGITTNSDECSYSSDINNSDDYQDNHCSDDKSDDLDFTPATILNPRGTSDRISCTIWDQREIKKAQLSVLEISSRIIENVESIPETHNYLYIGIFLSIILSLVPCFYRLCETTFDFSKFNDLTYFDILILLWERRAASFAFLLEFFFGQQQQWQRIIFLLSSFQRFILTLMLFMIFAVAERTFKQRFLYAKLFSRLTSSRRARKSNLPHFRLNKVRNIKTWLSVRSYLKKRGPQRSVDVIVSGAFLLTLLLLGFLSVEWLKDSVQLHSHLNLEALAWASAVGIFVLRYMTLGNKIQHKYRSVSVLITEQINLYLQIEKKPKKKEDLMVSNSVLKLAADLLKELETPFKISGLSANPFLFTTIKVVILSALSGVLSEMLGFKLKLHKIKIK